MSATAAKNVKKRILLIVCATAALVLVALALLFLLHPRFLYRRFLIADTVSSWFDKAEMQTVSPETLSVAAEELQKDSRIRTDNSLLLVRKGYALPADYQDRVVLQEYRETGLLMEETHIAPFSVLSQQILEKFDKKLLITSAYRTAEEQQQAIAEEGDLAAGVGESEHQAGLALDVAVKGYGGASFLKTDVGRYLNHNAWRYGFIIRYPYYGTEQTGISYEPWHIRYVGQPHATLIARNRLTLESYLDSLTPGTFYAYGDWLISLQPIGESYRFPAEYESLTVSPDNRGNLLFTFTVKD